MRTFDPSAWYRCCESGEQVLQGDQFFDVPLRRVIRDPNNPGQFAIGFSTADVIVATQSCDLQQEKVAEIEVAPVYSLVEWLSVQPTFFNQLESIRRGHAPSLYLPPAWPQAPFHSARTTRVVAFDEKRNLTWDDLQFLQQGRWMGLQSPYIKHFGQALARFYMRVGLPEDMPPLVWKIAEPTTASASEPLTLTNEQLANVDLPAPTRPLVASVQRLQLANGPDILYKATLKQEGSYFGIGHSSGEALNSLLSYLAVKRSEFLEKQRDEHESVPWLLSIFSFPSGS